MGDIKKNPFSGIEKKSALAEISDNGNKRKKSIRNKTISVRLNDTVYEEFRDLCENNGYSVNNMLNILILEYIEKYTHS